MLVISYYKYVPIENPYVFQSEHLALCKSLDLRGRVYVGKEGINGTVSGEVGNIRVYEKELRKNKLFSEIEFKEENVEEHAFRKIFVRVRREIVNFSEKVDNGVVGGKITPKDFKKLIENEEDLVILDVRNNYETQH